MQTGTEEGKAEVVSVQTPLSVDHDATSLGSSLQVIIDSFGWTAKFICDGHR